MAQAGGIGLADMMMAQLGRNLEDAGEQALRTSLAGREPLPVQPAPLDLERRSGREPGSGLSDALYGAQAPDIAGMPEPPEAGAVPEPPSEFDQLVERLETRMRQPQTTVTRVTTNASSINSFGTIKPGRQREPQIRRIVRTAAQTPGTMPAVERNGVMEAGPSLSPTKVDSSRTAAVSRAPTGRL
jgi:Rod binding domain-containing protein